MRARNVLLTGIVAAGLTFCTPSVRADLPVDVRTSTTPQTHAPAITQYIEALLKKVQGPDAKAASDARRELCEQCENKPGGPTIPAGFQLVYSGLVDKALQPLIKSKNVPDRLNAAIILYRLAGSTKSLTLQSSIQTVLADESEAVALWGVKAAGALMPTVLGGGFAANTEKLTVGIVQAVKKHPESGPIAQDAYRALDVSGVAGIPAAGIIKAADAMNEVLAFRIELYVKGAPADLQADRDPTLFIWKIVSGNPSTAPKSVQNLVNLMSVTAQRYYESPNGDTRDRFKNVSHSASGSTIVVLQTLKQTAPIAAFKPFQNLGLVTQDQFPNLLASAVTELRKIKEFKDIKDPPIVQPTAGATASN